MSLFAWKEAYSVGSAQIDLQHKQIVRMAGELHHAMVKGRDYETIQCLSDRLIAYVRYHFASEESIMRENGYPGLDQHHKSHEIIDARIDDFKNRMKDRKVPLPMELTRFLREFLDHHIRTDDMKLGVYLKTVAAARIVAAARTG